MTSRLQADWPSLFLSECPSDCPSATRFRTLCLSAFNSGKPPSIYHTPPWVSHIDQGSQDEKERSTSLPVPDELPPVVLVAPDAETAARLGRVERDEGDGADGGWREGEEELGLGPSGSMQPSALAMDGAVGKSISSAHDPWLADSRDRRTR